MSLRAKEFDLHLAHPWRISRTTGSRTVRNVFVGWTAPDGLIGWGEAAPVTRYGESAETVIQFISKVDSTHLDTSPSEAMAYLDALAPGNTSAKSALMMALADVQSRRAACPLYRFLEIDDVNGTILTSFSIGIDDPEVVRAKVAAAEAFPMLKIKLGGPRDEAVLRAVREVAPYKPLRIDANEAWGTKELALEKIEWLARDGNIQFIEQPMPASTADSSAAWLRARSPLPIFADESYHTSSDVERAAECFHGVNVKLSKAGGVFEARCALEAARKAGLRTMLGCMIESSLGITAAAHLAGLCDYVDLDGHLLITNDPFEGITAANGALRFTDVQHMSGVGAVPSPKGPFFEAPNRAPSGTPANRRGQDDSPSSAAPIPGVPLRPGTSPLRSHR